MAIVGENGAGKSTLMNVLYGLYRPDSGEVSLDGRRLKLRGPKDAIRHGIGMVHQHFMLVPTMSVTENVVLGREPTRFGVVDLAAAEEQVRATCERFGFKLDPRARVDSLSVGSQQKVEIVKALHRKARVLILDEPTAVLTPQEADELFNVVRTLVEGGTTVVLISHKLREVLQVAQRVVVMRRGRLVAERAARDTTAEELATLMVGAAPPRPTEAPRSEDLRGVVLAGRKLKLRREDGTDALRGVTVEVRGGEIVGVAGVDGNGQRELAEVLSGLRRAKGTLEVGGQVLEEPTPTLVKAAGLGVVPEDRHRQAMVAESSVEENVALGRHRAPPFARGRFIDFAGRAERTRSVIEQFDVRPPDAGRRMGDLSGGNQQKVVVGRELDRNPRALLAVQPTRGLDIAAVAMVHQRFMDERERGTGILLISMDLDEVLALCDRVYVLFGGRIMGEVQRSEFDAMRIGRLMLGQAGEAPVAA